MDAALIASDWRASVDALMVENRKLKVRLSAADATAIRYQKDAERAERQIRDLSRGLAAEKRRADEAEAKVRSAGLL